MSSTHTPGDETPDDDEIFPFIVYATTDRGQHIFCKNLLLNLFEPGISPCKTEFPDVKIKRQIIDHYLKDICNITQQYGIYSIEFTSPNHNNRKYTIQTDNLDLEFSKVFSEYIKSIQYHNSQRANSIFTNEVFAIIYSYISILENEIPITNVSPTETSKHLRVRHEITLLSSYLNIIKENFTKDDVSQHTKHDLQKILAWFIIDYFTHNIDLIAQARKNFRPQNSNDDTAITEQSDYVWDPEWSHPAFISFPQSISSQAISTISYIRDYVKIIPFTIDATPLNYNTFLPDTQNNSLNSTVIHNENLNGTRNLTQQDIQTPSHFINEEIVHTTTTQQSISPIRPNLTTPRNTNPSQTQVTLQSTVKPSVAPKYSHIDYQTYRPMTIPSKTRKTFTRNNFTDHNYNYTHPSKTYNQPQRNFNQYTRSRNWDNPMTQPNSINFQTNPPQDHSENYPFFQQNKNKKQTSYQMDYLSSDDDFLQPDIFAPNTQEYRRQGIQRTRTNHRNFSPQSIDAQHQQPIQQQNLINTQSFQPIQQQNPMTAHSYQPSQMQNEIPLPYYLQQHEITRNQLSNFSQMPNAAESLQMTMNPYLMGGSSITSNKPLMVFTGTDPEYSVEDYLNAVTANLILNIGPEPINTPLHQNWIHRRTALIQTTLDGAAQKWFSVLPLEIKSNWKRFTQEFSKMFDSERNKQQQRVLCNEIRRLPNETIKQIAVRIETLVRKAYSLNTHDYKNTKMTEILMMTLTPQLRKIAIKKRASHPSSIREPDLDFRKLVDKLEQAEITMKLEETENLKLQYVNRIETTPTNINNIQESETDLVEKITEILNIYEKNPNFKGKPSFKKWCNYCRRYGHSISECRQKQQDNQNKPQKYKEPNKSFHQYMKKDQNLPNKTVYSNNSSGKALPNNTNYTRNQSPYNSSYRGRSPERRNTHNSSQNHYNRPNSRNNYSRSHSNTQRFVSRSNSQSRNNYYPSNQSRNSSYNRNRNYSYNRNRSYSNNRNQNYPNNQSRNNSYNRSNYNRPNNNYQNRSRNNSQNRHSSYNNRYRNYSQSPHRNNNNYNNSNNRHRSSTPKHQRHINQVQSNPETTSDPPGIDDTVTDTLQLNQINCTSSDSESDTENTLSINMIKVENDYESVIYEQPFSSHIYENQSEFLQNYYTTPINSTPTTQETNEINTTNQTNKNIKTKCLNTNHIYQNIQKEQPKEKIWTIPFLLESPRNKEFQPPDLEIDFLIDSGAESNIINIPTWNEIKTLHPKLTPLETSSKLATAQGSTLINYGKIQLFLLPTRTMEQSKILNKPFKQIFHITDIKYNIIGIPFISKYIPTINILNSKILIKDKYTKTKETSLTFFQRLNKQPPFFSKFYLAENETSPRLECKYAVKTDIEQSQINSLQHFPLYLDCQNNHYEVDLLGTSTFKPIPYSQWIKNNTQQKRTKQHPPKKDHFPLIEKENLTDKINLSGPQTNDSKYTINQVFDLHDPLDTIPLSKFEIENIFLPPTETITISTLKQYQNLDPIIRQLKSWHKYKTKPVKADSTILGNKTLLRYFRKFNNTTINENTDLLEYNLNESTVPCLPLSMILIAFNISHTQNIKGHSGSEKTYSNFIQNFYFPNAPIWIKVLCNDCIVCQLNKPYPNQKQIAQKQDFKGQSLYFNHRISFDTKGPISPSSEGNSYIMVIVDAFTHYVALNPVPHCNAYYAYTTLYEHWIAKFGLPEILVTDNGTEFINNEIITLCHLYNIKHKPRTSHAPWTNGLVEGMNRSLQEYLRCIINGNDRKYTEWSADVKLFPLAYNSQITTTLGMSPYEMVFNQKPRKPIMFTVNSHKNAQGYCQPNKDSICYNLPLHTHDEDHFHHPQILKLASGTHTEWILNRDKKHTEIYQKITKKLLQRQNINEQINSRFTPASELKIGTFVLIPNFNTQKGISKKLQPLRKGPYQIIAKPTDVTYKITDSNKKEIVQHRNNLLPYYPKEYALRELTQLYSFTGLKIIQNEPHLKNTEQNDNPTENQNTKPTATKNNTQNHKESPKQGKNRKMTEQIIPQEQIDKSENRKTTRLRNQPRKNYKIFIPQSKILKKVEFQK